VAWAKAALPSAIMRTLPAVFWSRPQAPITKASLTDTHQISSTPAALNGGLLHVARHVLGRAGGRVGAWQREDRDLLACCGLLDVKAVGAEEQPLPSTSMNSCRLPAGSLSPTFSMCVLLA
jgi:hypothetical protein